MAAVPLDTCPPWARSAVLDNAQLHDWHLAASTECRAESTSDRERRQACRRCQLAHNPLIFGSGERGIRPTSCHSMVTIARQAREVPTAGGLSGSQVCGVTRFGAEIPANRQRGTGHAETHVAVQWERCA